MFNHCHPTVGDAVGNAKGGSVGCTVGGAVGGNVGELFVVWLMLLFELTLIVWPQIT